MSNPKDTLRITEGEYDSLCLTYGESLVTKEIELELEAKALAKDKFINELSKRASKGTISGIGTTKTLLKETLPVVTKALKDLIEKADTGKAGRKHTLVTVLKKIEPETLSYLTVRCILNQTALYPLASLVGLCKNIGDQVEKEIRFSEAFKAKGDDKTEKSYYDSLSKRVGLSYKEAYCKAIEAHLRDDGYIDKYTKWDSRYKTAVGLKLVEVFCYSTGLGRLQKVHKGSKIDYGFELDPQVSQYISYNDEQLAELVFKCRPMVIPPKEWTNPFDGGYYIKLKRPELFVKAPKKVVKEVYSEVDMPEVYKAVNAIQSTAWRINRRVYETAVEVLGWKNIPESLGIPSKELPDPPLRPEEADTNPEVQKAWRASMVRFYQKINSDKGKRLLTDALLSEAKNYKEYEAIYFPYNVDFRGRVYPLTTLSPQGNDLSKSLLEFSEGIPLGSHGVRWLAFHGANCYGLDKKPLEERLEWVYTNQDFILSIAKNPLENLAWTEADSPFEFLAFCFEWEGYINEGENYKSHIAVAFDGSCSGLQHFSAMLKDEIGGVAVNLVPDTKVHDIYKIVADKVIDKLKVDYKEGTDDTIETAEDGNQYLQKGTRSLAKEWLDYGVTRSVTKRSVMTLAYGSKEYGFSEQVLEDTVYPALSKNPMAFSKPGQSSRYMAKLIWDSVSETVVKAVEAMKWLQTASALLASEKDINGNAIPVFWVTPAGFPVRQKYEKKELKRIRTILNGSILIVDPVMNEKTELGAGDSLSTSLQIPVDDKLDSRKQRQGIAPNFVHSMDASHLMLTVNSCYDQGVRAFAMIHDSYGTHAGMADIMFKTVREVFVKTYTENDVLQNLHDHVALQLSPKNLEKLPEIPEKGSLDLESVKESLYAFS